MGPIECPAENWISHCPETEEMEGGTWPGLEMAGHCPRPVEERSRHGHAVLAWESGCGSPPGPGCASDTQSNPPRRQAASRGQPWVQAGVWQNLLNFDQSIENLWCEAVLFGFGSLHFLVFRIIVF